MGYLNHLDRVIQVVFQAELSEHEHHCSDHASQDGWTK
jgi:hypothetical protein